jgi:hypothetical protein
MTNWGKEYLAKMRGDTVIPPRVRTFEIVWSWLGAFLGIAAVSYLNCNILDGSDLG